MLDNKITLEIEYVDLAENKIGIICDMQPVGGGLSKTVCPGCSTPRVAGKDGVE